MENHNSINFTEYRKGSCGQVPCAKCSQMIPANATSCPYCGIHFSGAAVDFTPGEREEGETGKRWLRIMTWLILLLAAGLAAVWVMGLVR